MRKKLILVSLIFFIGGVSIYIANNWFSNAEPLRQITPNEPLIESADEKETYKAPLILEDSEDDILEKESPDEDIDKKSISFKNALFIGDSRTEGFHIQSGITEGTFLTQKGLMVNTAMTDPVIKHGDGKITVLEAVSLDQYDQIFIMLGINELGWAYESIFIDTYRDLLEKIIEFQKDSKIYVQSIIRVSEEKSKKDPIYNNKAIDRYNILIQELVIELGLNYVDLNSIFSNESGHLFSDASFDGVHLKPAYCQKWFEFLIERLKIDLGE